MSYGVSLPRACWALAFAGCVLAPAAGGEERRNWFDDPFQRATSGQAACPVPEGPLLTQAEMRREAHQRAERGTSCWLAKQCEAPNAYLHDREINAAVVAVLGAEPRWRDTSVWVTTQRGFVTLQGCVRSAAQRSALAARVQAIPRVLYVVDELQLGTAAKPPYRVAR